MSIDSPLVSVCIITYNQEKYIGECLEKALAQKTSFAYEVLVGDDCSTDKTGAICRDFQAKHPDKVKYIRREKNLGMVGNWEATIKGCKGKYIALCEGDDYWADPKKLQKQVDFLEANPSFSLSYHDAILVDENGKPLGRNVLQENQKRDFSEYELNRGALVVTASICFRNIIPYFPKEFYKVNNSDTFLTSLLGNYGKGHFHHDIAPSAYRIHSGGVWSLVSDIKKNANSANTFLNLLAYHGQVGRPREVLDGLFARYLNASAELFKILLKQGQWAKAFSVYGQVSAACIRHSYMSNYLAANVLFFKITALRLTRKNF